MARNLDITALRSFVTVADTGKVTAAASRLNLTQSAVSMQLKRLEELLDLSLLDRAGRGVTLTSEGEQLLSYARRMVTLNDEAWSRLTHSDFEGELVLGVPHDIVYPHAPEVLQRFAREYPRVKVNLDSSYTMRLKEKLAGGEADLILTTETTDTSDGETLEVSPLVWVGAPGGSAWKSRPLRLAYERVCLFRGPVQARLDAAGVPWEMAVESESTRSIEASVSADLAVHTSVACAVPPDFEVINHGGALPELDVIRINMYLGEGPRRPLIERLAAIVRDAYGVRTGAMAAQ
ncbi:MAG: LysR family transcriptional regulator [Pseudomonadota bacterium]